MLQKMADKYSNKLQNVSDNVKTKCQNRSEQMPGLTSECIATKYVEQMPQYVTEKMSDQHVRTKVRTHVRIASHMSQFSEKMSEWVSESKSGQMSDRIHVRGRRICKNTCQNMSEQDVRNKRNCRIYVGTDVKYLSDQYDGSFSIGERSSYVPGKISKCMSQSVTVCQNTLNI